MSSSKLKVCFLWHMHQPMYFNPLENRFLLPWVRLHCYKDYYDMPSLLADYPGIKVTFNLSPSLLLQIDLYANKKATDDFYEIGKMDAEAMPEKDRIFLLSNFFNVNYERIIKPQPRYLELLAKRGESKNPVDLKKALTNFSKIDFRDLQVLFYLAWCGRTLRQDPLISELVKKGKNFTIDEKEALFNKLDEFISKIMPLYSQLAVNGNISISTSPLCHPILPLLIDTESAREAKPDIRLPSSRFLYPQDANRQVELGMIYAEHFLKTKINGIWPSEASVSDSAIPIFLKNRVRWIASDQEILRRSKIKNFDFNPSAPLPPPLKYRPAKIVRQEGEMLIFFRDRLLSDLIGFTYYSWQPEIAAQDLIQHILRIKSSLPDDGKDYVVSIILDGENAWEYYQDNGTPFLRALYSQLQNLKEIEVTTFDQIVNSIDSNLPIIEHLFAGSWINSDFSIWIGHPDKNKAWDILYKVREEIGNYQKERGSCLNSKENQDLLNAWLEIFAAEGSDWFWWYGEDHYSEYLDKFDEIFRTHLKNVYQLIGKTPPPELEIPIRSTISKDKIYLPLRLIHPQIDGRVTSFLEWESAGFFDVSGIKGMMHQMEHLTDAIYFGFDQEYFYLRMDLIHHFTKDFVRDFTFIVKFIFPKWIEMIISFDKKENFYRCQYRVETNGDFEIKNFPRNFYKVDRILEMKIKADFLGVKVHQPLCFFVSILKGDQLLERWPLNSVIEVERPPENFNELNWTV